MNQCLKQMRRRRKRDTGIKEPEDEPIEDDPVLIDYVEPQVSGEVNICIYQLRNYFPALGILVLKGYSSSHGEIAVDIRLNVN